MIPAPIRAAVVAGVAVDDVTMPEALDAITAFVAEGRASGRSFQVATVNVDFVIKAREHPDVMAILQRADLCLADGMPVVWHARACGVSLRERVTGADLVPLLVERARDNGWKILLFGSAAGVAESAAEILVDRFPGALVSGMSGPMMTDVRDIDAETLAEIAAFGPDVICVALGNPKQERWIEAHRDTVGASVLIGVGGTLDFLVGGRRRAPKWMRHSGLEWIYRASQEPVRLGKRYARDAVHFAPLFGRALVDWFRARVRGGASASRPFVVRRSSRPGIDTVDLADQDVQPRHAADLVGLARDSGRHGGRLELLHLSTSSKHTLERLEITTMFEYAP